MPREPLKIDELMARPSYQFFSAVEQLLNDCNALTVKKTFFSDGLEPIRADLDSLTKACRLLKPLLLPHEENRKPCESSQRTLDKLKKAETNLDAARETLSKLKLSFEENKSKFRLKETQLNEAIDRQNSTDLVEEAKQIAEINILYNQLHTEKTNLTAKLRGIEKKIAAACCSCFPKCIEQETKEQKEVEGEIDIVNNKLSEINRKKISHDKSEIIKKLEDELVATQQKQKEFIDNYPKQLEEAKNNLVNAEATHRELTLELDANHDLYYAAISNAIMLASLRTYVRFVDLKKSVEKLYNATEESSEIAKKVDALHTTCLTSKTSIDNCFFFLWCPNSQDKNGQDIYTAYTGLSAALQQALLGSSPQDSDITQLLPNQAGAQLNSLIKHEINISARLFKPATKPHAVEQKNSTQLSL